MLVNEFQQKNVIIKKRSPSQKLLQRQQTPGSTPIKSAIGDQFNNQLTELGIGGGMDDKGIMKQRRTSKLQSFVYQKQNLNLSTVNANNNDVHFFPSLSQTPKFDITQLPGQQQQINQVRHNRIRSMQGGLLTTGSRAGSRSRIEQRAISNSRLSKGANRHQKEEFAWEKNKINQFSVRNYTPQQVIETLLEQVMVNRLNNQGFLERKPQDLDSTDALDSFIECLYLILEGNVMQYNEQLQNQLHLSTGTRTSICDSVLAYIIQLQNLHNMFQDTVVYFKEPIVRLADLEILKEELEKSNNELTNDKQQLFLAKYDLERKMNEMIKTEEQFKKKEQELQQKLRSLQKKYNNSKEECQSLKIRNKHLEDLSNMMEPPMSHQSIVAEANGESDPSSDQPHLTQQVASGDNSSLQRYQQQERKQVLNLEKLNKKLQEELDSLKQAQFEDKVDHFAKIQELFNRAQIENKNLKSQCIKLESMSESKEKLIQHLEQKVTSVMLEKEEQIVQLKSEVLILKGIKDQNDNKFNEKLEQNKERLEKEIKKSFKDQIHGLKNDITFMNRDKNELEGRLDALQKEYSALDQAYTQLRDNKSELDKERDAHMNDIESKLGTIHNHYEAQLQQLRDKIDQVDNLNTVLTKENEIVELKMRYFEERVSILVKQKTFIKEEIEKSWKMLQNEFDVLRNGMLYNEDKKQNQDYLISVKKGIKQAQNMADIGVQALNNIAEIVNFLKIEELNQLLLGNISLKNEAVLIKYEDDQNKELEDTIQAKQRFQSKRSSQQTHIDPIESLKIQKFLSGRRISHQNEQNEVGIKQQEFDNIQESQKQFNAEIERNEEYYIHHCSVEMCGVLLKFIAELLIQLDICDEFEQLPLNFSTLLELANEKSDKFVEMEIFQKYLRESKLQIDVKLDEINQIKDQTNIILEQQQMQEQVQEQQQVLENTDQQVKLKLQQETEEDQQSAISEQDQQQQQQLVQPKVSANISISPSKSRANSYFQSPINIEFLNLMQQNANSTSNQQQIQLMQQQDQIASQLEQRRKEQRHNSVYMLMSPSGAKSSIREGISPSKNKLSFTNNISGSRQKEMNSSTKKSYNSMTKQQMVKEIQDLKLQIETLTLQLESQKLEHQEQKLKTKEMQTQLATKIVVLEEQLEKSQQDRDIEAAELEQIQKNEIERVKQGIQQRENLMQQSLREYKERIQYLEKEISAYQKEINENNIKLDLFEKERHEFDNMRQTKDKEFIVLKENVQEYINIKSSNRCTFGLAFEINERNQSMINEAMLKYYLNKILGINKDKFRFLMTLQEQYANNNSMVTVAKLIIEITDDEVNVHNYCQMLKLQIRDGSCLLYDLEPLYISLNLGQFGINGYNQLSDFHILQKKSHIISNQEFVVTVLRHKFKALVFKIMAINYICGSGEEYILDLLESDVYELVEGDIKLLENEQPENLINNIVDNLVLIEKDQLKILVCEHKVFFSSMFHNLIESSSYNQFSSNINMSEDKYSNGINIYNQQSQLDNSFRHTLLRNNLIIQQKLQDEINYEQQLVQQQECQTDFEGSLIYEGFQILYQQNQRVGKKLEVRISISYAQHSNSLKLICEEVKSRQKSEVCFINNKIMSQHIFMNKQESLEEYIVYSQCMKIKRNHLVLFSAEKILDEGFFIKIHDLKYIISEEFFLCKKSNNQYSKLTRQQGNSLMLQEDFRNLIYDLTFQFSLQIPTQQIMQASIEYHKEIQELKQDNQQTQQQNTKRFLTLSNQKQKSIVQKEIPFTNINQKLIQQVNTQTVLQEKGQLLYRNVYLVRCNFEQQEEVELPALISFYYQNKQQEVISVDVYLYNNNNQEDQQQKMSITSQVSSKDLFGTEELSFKEKVENLDQMMEKLFVLSENSNYHLKVENDSMPISEVLESRKAMVASSENNNLPLFGNNTEKTYIEDKIRDIQSNRVHYLGDDKSLKMQKYIILDNQAFEASIYFINYYKITTGNERESQERLNATGGSSSPRKTRTIQKRLSMDRKITNIDAFIEDHADFEYIYIEMQNKDQDLYTTIITQQQLAQIILNSPSFKGIGSRHKTKNKELLVDHMLTQVKIDYDTGYIKINEDKQLVKKVIKQFQNELAGQFQKNKLSLLLEGYQQNQNLIQSQNSSGYLQELMKAQKKNEIEQSLIKKQLIVNNEIEMIEFVYDIKIFENILNDNEQVLSYSIQLFSLNDPESVYNFNFPLQQEASTIQDNNDVLISTQFSLGIDQVNITENNQHQKLVDTIETNKVKQLDNCLIITVQEQKFPFQLDFSVVEVTSKIQWNYKLTAQQCSNQLVRSLGKLNIIEQQIHQQCLLNIINCNQEEEKQINNENLVIKKENGNKVIDIDQLVELHNQEIIAGVELNMSKEDNAIIIKLERDVLDFNKGSQSTEQFDKIDLIRNMSSFSPQIKGVANIDVQQHPNCLYYKLDISNYKQKSFFQLITIIQQQQQMKILLSVIIKEDYILLKVLNIEENQLIVNLKIVCQSTPNHNLLKEISEEYSPNMSNSEWNNTSLELNQLQHKLNNSTTKQNQQQTQISYQKSFEAFLQTLKSIHDQQIIEQIVHLLVNTTKEEDNQHQEENIFFDKYSFSVKKLQMLLQNKKKNELIQFVEQSQQKEHSIQEQDEEEEKIYKGDLDHLRLLQQQYQQQNDEIMEMDEEDEEDSVKKHESNFFKDFQRIEEEGSFEEQDDNSPDLNKRIDN